MEIFVHQNGENHVEEGFAPEDLPALLRDEKNVVWVDMEQPTEADDKILADVFKFHYLTIEDARETRNQPKVEAFPDYLFFIVHGISIDETNPKNFVTKELDGFLGKNFVVTYHHENFLSIDTVKKQVRASSYACARGADYLLHQILDQIVDLYIPIVDEFDETINELEDRVFRMKKTSNDVLQEIMDLKRSVARLIRISSKQMNVLYRISHGEFPLISNAHLPFYRDVHDHLQRVADLAENYRDLISGLLDIHLSVVANKTNEVMKVLAVFSAIMLPLTLIAGIYGMNVPLPDQTNSFSFWHIVVAMVLFTAILLIYFWRKGWIFQHEEDNFEPDTEKMQASDE